MEDQGVTNLFVQALTVSTKHFFDISEYYKTAYPMEANAPDECWPLMDHSCVRFADVSLYFIYIYIRFIQRRFKKMIVDLNVRFLCTNVLDSQLVF